MEKVFFTKSVGVVPVMRGVYSNPMDDIVGFQFIVEKSAKPRRQRRYGEDPEYDAVMRNFGQTPSADGNYPEQQLVFGFANVSIQENGIEPKDWQGDAIAPEVLEAAAYNYVLRHGLVNQEHNWDAACGWLVESIMFTKEKMEALNIPVGIVPEGWWVGFFIPDKDVYDKTKNGEYNMFSIEGTASRVPSRVQQEPVDNGSVYV